MSDKKPCHKCKGHALTHGACHAKCERYNAFKQGVIEAKKDIKKSAQDARAANKYSS